MDDAIIVALLVNNPQDGLHELIKGYRGLVGAIIGRILNAYPLDVEECIADTFVAVWRHSKKLDRNKGTLKGFIACTARNIAIDRYRKLSKEKAVSIKELELLSNENISDILEQKYDVKTMQALIAGMKEPDREIFIRKFFLIQSNKEIVETMGLNEKQVKNRLYQGKLRLKIALKERDIQYD